MEQRRGARLLCRSSCRCICFLLEHAMQSSAIRCIRWFRRAFCVGRGESALDGRFIGTLGVVKASRQLISWQAQTAKLKVESSWLGLCIKLCGVDGRTRQVSLAGLQLTQAVGSSKIPSAALSGCSSYTRLRWCNCVFSLES